MKTFYLCDGKVKNCSKNECYIFGGQCSHTEKIENGKNLSDERKFITNANGDNWEVE